MTWFLIGALSLLLFYLAIASSERHAQVHKPPPLPRLFERPPSWQPPAAHQEQMRRIAALPIRSHHPAPRLETRPFLIRYHLLPEGSLHEIVVDAYDLNWALAAARRLGIEIDVVVEVMQPPPNETKVF